MAFAKTPPVQNPSGIAFTPSSDHANITAYEAEIRTSPGGAVIQTLNLGKPGPNTQGEIVVAMNAQPIAFGSYVIVVRSIAGTVRGPVSTPTDIWERAPGAPSKLRVQ